MVDKEKLQKKINLQKTKNIISKIEGIQVIDYEEQYLFDEEYLRKIKFFSSDKVADSKISDYSNDYEVIEWIYKLMDFQIDQVWYIFLNGFLIKIQILDIKTAIMSLWNGIYEYDKGFVLVNEKKSTMFEFGSDSRDEENYLFDKYPLIQ